MSKCDNEPLPLEFRNEELILSLHYRLVWPDDNNRKTLENAKILIYEEEGKDNIKEEQFKTNWKKVKIWSNGYFEIRYPPDFEGGNEYPRSYITGIFIPKLEFSDKDEMFFVLSIKWPEIDLKFKEKRFAEITHVLKYLLDKYDEERMIYRSEDFYISWKEYYSNH